MSDSLPPREFVDFVAAGCQLVARRDNNAWELGDLCVDAVRELGIKPGRPTDPDAVTLSSLAAAWDVGTPRVSEWHAVADFYVSNVRTYEGLTWTHYNMARRASGGSLENAQELLSDAVNKHLGVNAFRRYLRGEYFEGEVAYRELPPRLQALVPDKTLQVWVVIREIE